MKTLTVYYSSDIHGYVYGNADSTNGLLDCFAQIQKDGNTLILDGGDNLQGSPLASYLHDQADNQFLAEMMNRYGYDVVTLGNHDFNYGVDYQKTYLDRLHAKKTCINVCDDAGKPLYPFVVMTMENGLKVGIIGLVTDFVNVWEKAENLKGLQVNDAYDALVKTIDSVNACCDISIVIYHGGYEADLSTGNIVEKSGENCGYRIACNLPVDLLCTGHQHMPHDLIKINGTYTFQAANYGKKLGKVVLYIDDVHQIDHADFQWIEPRNDHQMIKDPMVETMDEKLNAWLNRPIAHLSMALTPRSYLDMAVHNNEIPVLINRIMSDCLDCPLSITSMANNIYGLKPEVTLHDLLMVYPYTNTLVKLELDGSTLLELIETNMDYLQYDNGAISINPRFEFPKKTHYNYDYYQGISFTLHIDAPKGNRVFDVKVLGEPLDLSKHYAIVTNSYRASGTGGFECIKKAKIIQRDDREFLDIILAYFAKHDRIECQMAQPYIHIQTSDGSTIA